MGDVSETHALPTHAPAKTAPEFARFGLTTVSLCLAGVLVVSQLYVVIPVLGDIARSWSVDATAAGWTATSFGLGYAVGFLLFGPLADRFDHRRLLVAGLFATAVATAAVALTGDVVIGCVARAVQGLLAATFAPTAFAYVAQHLAPARRMVATAWLTSFFISSAVLGQVFAQLTSALGGWRLTFVVSAVALAGAATLLRAVLRSDTSPAANSALAAYRPMAGLLTRPAVLLLLGATATVLASMVAVYAALQLAGPASLVGDPGALLGLRASALPAMLVVPLMTPLLVRLPAAARVATALLLAAAAVGVAAVLGNGDISAVLLAGLLFPFAFAIAVAAPALVQALGALAGAARSAAVALYTFALFVGASAGPLLAGVLLDTGLLGPGFAGVLTGIVVLLVIGAALAALAHRYTERKNTP